MKEFIRFRIGFFVRAHVRDIDGYKVIERAMSDYDCSRENRISTMILKTINGIILMPNSLREYCLARNHFINPAYECVVEGNRGRT